MNKRNDESLVFGWRKVQKVRHSYTVVIPKALAGALGLKEGDNIGFALTGERQLVLQMEEIHSEGE
jgi:antitoxin component of MazEF toxin-antitoxin module